MVYLVHYERVMTMDCESHRSVGTIFIRANRHEAERMAQQVITRWNVIGEPKGIPSGETVGYSYILLELYALEREPEVHWYGTSPPYGTKATALRPAN